MPPLPANEVRLQLSVLICNLGNLWRRLVLPRRIGSWSLTSLQQRVVKTGGRLVKHSRVLLAHARESHPTQRLFGSMLQRIWALPIPTGYPRGGHQTQVGNSVFEQSLRAVVRLPVALTAITEGTEQ